MRKVFFLCIFLVLFAFSQEKHVYAADLPGCTAPRVGIDRNDNFNTVVTVTVPPNLQKDGTEVQFFVTKGPNTTDNVAKDDTTVLSGKAIFNLGKIIPATYNYSLYYHDRPGGKTLFPACKGSITIPDEGQGGSTEPSVVPSRGSLTFSPPNPKPTDQIIVTVTNLPNEGIYYTAVMNDGKNENTQCVQSTNKQISYIIGPFDKGTRDIFIMTAASIVQGGNEVKCTGRSLIASGKITIIPFVNLPTTSPTPVPPYQPPCAPGKYDPQKGCQEVNTGLGINLPTTPEGFIKALFSLLLSISGAIALVLFILAGYKYMTSQGEPEKIKEAQGEITSAIIGLLFLIFSMVILQVIGVDILKIPFFQ